MTTQTKGLGARRTSSRRSSVQVQELDEALLVRVHVAEGVLELRVPENSTPARQRPRHRIPGCNPDATPC
jgi:hypothetical protein